MALPSWKWICVGLLAWEGYQRNSQWLRLGRAGLVGEEIVFVVVNEVLRDNSVLYAGGGSDGRAAPDIGGVWLVR